MGFNTNNLTPQDNLATFTHQRLSSSTVMSSQTLAIRKSYNLYIEGAFIRSEGGWEMAANSLTDATQDKYIIVSRKHPRHTVTKLARPLKVGANAHHS